MVHVAAEKIIHGSAMQTLRLGHGAFLVGEEERLEVDNLLA